MLSDKIFPFLHIRLTVLPLAKYPPFNTEIAPPRPRVVVDSLVKSPQRLLLSLKLQFSIVTLYVEI